MLVDMGAEVVKVEPPEGDMFRFQRPRPHSMSVGFAQQNCGKRNISVDLGIAGGVDLARALAAKADVVVENFRPGVMDRLGIGWDVLADANPRLVFASISGYGQEGSWAGRGAYAMMVHAEMGYLEGESRYHDEEPSQEPYSHGDIYTGIQCFSAILAALYQREHTGQGQRIDVSMAETLLCVNEFSGINLSGFTEELPLPTSASPLFKTQAGRIISVAFDPTAKGTFAAWVKAMDRPDLAEDPRFAEVEPRQEHRQELLDVLQEWVLTFETLDELETALHRGRLVMGTIRSIAEAGASTWAAERGAVVEVSDRGGGTIKLPNSPWRLSGADTGVRGEPAYRGEHNAFILQEWLDAEPGQIAALEAEGVLTSHLPE
jgi:crotonobetainyl-CoA:carnitine CoA-transferase CaiB-like acyl-CoA transferase